MWLEPMQASQRKAFVHRVSFRIAFGASGEPDRRQSIFVEKMKEAAKMCLVARARVSRSRSCLTDSREKRICVSPDLVVVARRTKSGGAMASMALTAQDVHREGS